MPYWGTAKSFVFFAARTSDSHSIHAHPYLKNVSMDSLQSQTGKDCCNCVETATCLPWHPVPLYSGKPWRRRQLPPTVSEPFEKKNSHNNYAPLFRSFPQNLHTCRFDKLTLAMPKRTNCYLQHPSASHIICYSLLRLYGPLQGLQAVS